MKALTKTQINHFMERARAAANLRAAEMLEESAMMLPDFDPRRAKIEAIIKGEVELLVDFKDAEWFLRKALDDAFPDPRSVCEYKTKRQELERCVGKYSGLPKGRWVDELNEYVRALADRFVLGDIHEGNVLEVIEGVKTWRPADYWPLVRASNPPAKAA